MRATLAAVMTILAASGCWKAQELPAAGADGGDTDDTESGGMTDPETDSGGAWEWEVMISGTSNDLTGVWGRSGDEVYAVGRSGTILRYDGNADLEWVPEPFPSDAPGSDLGAVSGAADGVPVAVGATGTAIARLAGGGWAPVPTGTEADLHGVCLSGDGGGWAVGNDGTVLALDGASWQPLSSGVSETLMDVACWPGGAYAVGHASSSGMSSLLLRLDIGSAIGMEHPTAHFMYAVSTAEDGASIAVAGQYQTSQEAGPYFQIHSRDPVGWSGGPIGYALVLDMEERLDADFEQIELFMVGRTNPQGDQEYPVIYRKAAGVAFVAEAVYTHGAAGALRGVWRDRTTDTGDIFAVGDDGLIIRGRRTVD
jgi:hypothetical protein